MPVLKYGRTQIHTITYETLYNILNKVFHGLNRMTTVERTKPTITHASMIYHLDKLLRADLVSADRKRNLALTERGQKCLRAFQDIESYLKYDSAFAPPYEVKLISRAHFEHLYDDGIMQWKPPRKRWKS